MLGLDDESPAGLGDRADEANAKLYSGTVNSPRELQAMQADVDMLPRSAPTSKTRSLKVTEVRSGGPDVQLAALVAQGAGT